MTNKYEKRPQVAKRIITNLCCMGENKCAMPYTSGLIWDPLMWDVMARHELQCTSHTTSSCTNTATTSADSFNVIDTNRNIHKEKIRRIRRCCAVYTEALHHEPSQMMWSLYVRTLLELNQDLMHFPIFKNKLLQAVFGGAHSSGYMNDKFYLQWVDLLKSTNQKRKCKSILKLANERFPLSVGLWKMRLRYHMCRNQQLAALTVFENAIASLGSDNPSSLPLWRLLIRFSSTKSLGRVELAFLNGFRQGSAVSSVLKPIYLQWLVEVSGIEAGRECYKALRHHPPLCLELHLKMASLECAQPVINLQKAGKCYNLACLQFGNNNADVWLEYIKFQQKHGNNKNIVAIYRRALQTLAHTEHFERTFFLSTGLKNISTSPW